MSNNLNNTDLTIKQPDHIKAIVAEGPMVSLILESGNKIHLTRKEALLRAQLIVGLDKQGIDFAESLIKAANEALINETGKGYESTALKHMYNDIKAEHKRIKPKK